MVSGNHKPDKVSVDPETITRFIKKWGKKLGAVEIGITHCRDYHFYTVGGRRDRYGKKISNEHRFSIACTVEMDVAMMASAPAAPTLMESAEQYLKSGTIAVQISEFIRNLGYSARAHIDANYELICPTLARDAGLGDIGRIGLLMTPNLGPRVRISVITTNIPLVIDQPSHEPALLDFCNRCKKCAEVCPADAISCQERETIDGILRWKIDSEACYTFWTKAGTDCGRCVYVCPFSHPDNRFHRWIRRGIKNSIIFSRIALHMDHFTYGKKPRPKRPPQWIPPFSEDRKR
jgi:reductive dehalogenase